MLLESYGLSELKIARTLWLLCRCFWFAVAMLSLRMICRSYLVYSQIRLRSLSVPHIWMH
jgi:hypothetical protein